MKKEDNLCDKFIEIIKEYDVQGFIKDHKKLAKLFSSIIKTSPEIRELFLKEASDFSKKIKTVLSQIEEEEPKEFNCKIKKLKILN